LVKSAATVVRLETNFEINFFVMPAISAGTAGHLFRRCCNADAADAPHPTMRLS
jgi:hypothetical protein